MNSRQLVYGSVGMILLAVLALGYFNRSHTICPPSSSLTANFELYRQINDTIEAKFTLIDHRGKREYWVREGDTIEGFYIKAIRPGDAKNTVGGRSSTALQPYNSSYMIISKAGVEFNLPFMTTQLLYTKESEQDRPANVLKHAADR